MNCEQGRFYTCDGSDAVGKTSIADILTSQYGVVVLCCPPQWMRPYRKSVEHAPIELRFLFYILGNLWIDRMFLRPQMEHQSKKSVFFQDRSWLTTLVSHERRGVSQFWLMFGERMAKRSTQPDIAFLIHVDFEERKKRLLARSLVTDSDLLNLTQDNTFDSKCVVWAKRLGWDLTLFDNTHLTKEQASKAIAQNIFLKKVL